MELIDREKIEWYGCNFETPRCESENRKCSECSHAECSHAQVMQLPSIKVPDNATNGDMIKAMLNPYKICEYEYSVHVYMTEEDFWKSDYQMNCHTRWWNAPYKG